MGNVFTAALQVEFPLRVSVCAWCRPDRCGASAGEVSHGICLRHLRKLKFEIQGVAVKRRRRSSPQELGQDREILLAL
jgi:hypothetical protein